MGVVGKMGEQSPREMPKDSQCPGRLAGPASECATTEEIISYKQ